MDIFRKNPLWDAVSVKSIVSVWRFEIGGVGAPVGDLHDFYELVFVEEGTYRVVVDGEEFEIGAGECFLYPPLAFHIGAEKRERAVIRIISFESDSDDLKKIERKPIKASSFARELFTEANEIGLKSFFYPGCEDGVRGMQLLEGANAYSLQKMKKSLELFFIELICRTESTDGEGKNSKNFKEQRAAALTGFLRMNLSRQLSLSEMADAISVSVSTLKAITEEAFNTSPLSYFIGLRISAAKKLIRESSLTFTEISERLGFSSVHYFSRLFKNQVGMTPSEYSRCVEF
ncbi:MAG: helix-turn-helix transcriptional regulator [Clostridia bacterium]|nr:helix-turn-helix transcriptional regulator [Clostridia bacterium]